MADSIDVATAITAIPSLGTQRVSIIDSITSMARLEDA
jgi:hypothetical protein